MNWISTPSCRARMESSCGTKPPQMSKTAAGPGGQPSHELAKTKKWSRDRRAITSTHRVAKALRTFDVVMET